VERNQGTKLRDWNVIGGTGRLLVASVVGSGTMARKLGPLLSNRKEVPNWDFVTDIFELKSFPHAVLCQFVQVRRHQRQPTGSPDQRGYVTVEGGKPDFFP
jgi:hypothetical protein